MTTELLRRDARPGGGVAGLARSEVRRFTSRRFIRWLLGLAVLGYLVIVPLIAITQFGRTTEAMRAEARAEVDRIVAEQETYRAQCLKSPLPPDAPPGMAVEDYCGPPATAEDIPVDQFLPRTPFNLASALEPGAIAVGTAVAVLFFVVGATWVGAEWSARTMMALLFWETRRIRVLLTKIAVLVAAAAAFAVVAQVVWVGSAWWIAATRGSTGGLPKGFWTDAAALTGRTVLFAVLTSLIGFAVAQLIRGTGAALGVGFVYFAVIESAVQGIRPGWSQWLLTTNSAALVANGGIPIYVQGTTVSATGQLEEGREIVIGNLHGGLVLGGVTLALLALGAYLFRRRDLT